MHNKLFLKLVTTINKRYIWLVSRFYKIKNRNRKRVLVFTDSRGFEVTKKWNRKNPFSSYVKYLVKDYNVTFYICPEFSTTFVDFLDVYEKIKDNGKFDLVICHLGLVDYSVRPISMVERMYQDKREKLLRLGFSDEDINLHLNSHLDEIYDSEKTNRFLTKGLFINYIEEKLIAIPNLIMIGINPVCNDWQGNYWKKRPLKINENLDFDEYLNSRFTNYISLRDWNENNVRQYTCDNIHPSVKGFKVIYNLLSEKISNIERMSHE